MTIWDSIYRTFRSGGEAWASLKDDINPHFKRFLDEMSFEKKSALDIGCGTGIYLKYLVKKGFAVTGIDSSESAIEMAGESVPQAALAVSDMFSYEIPKGRYDLIISIAALHHARKRPIRQLLDRIHEALLDGGKFFFIIPSIDALKSWATFKDSKKLAEGVYVPMTGPEKGLAHSFYTEEEVRELLKRFTDIHLEKDERSRWVAYGSKAVHRQRE